MISMEDYLAFVDDALDGMVDIVTGLGDDLANRRLDIAGANSPYAVLTPCLGVLEYWGGHVVAGRRIERDRDAEFRSAGGTRGLVERTRQARRQLVADVASCEPLAPPRPAARWTRTWPTCRSPEPKAGLSSTSTRSWRSTVGRWT
ncbi:MAG: hypothetical protein ACRDWY_18540 [Actinomycetes bacterium]